MPTNALYIPASSLSGICCSNFPWSFADALLVLIAVSHISSGFGMNWTEIEHHPVFTQPAPSNSTILQVDTFESRSLLRTHLDAALIRTDSQQLESNTIGNLDLGRIYIQRRPSAQADDLSVLQVVFCFRKSRDLHSIQSSEPEANPNSIFSCLESFFQVQRWHSLAIMSKSSTVDNTEFELIVPFTQGVPRSAEDAFYEFLLCFTFEIFYCRTTQLWQRFRQKADASAYKAAHFWQI
jgi:hypothetical protein